jgi:asparagine synthase (glutamine-hydrolysing)
LNALAGAFGPAGALTRAVRAAGADAHTLDDPPLLVAWTGDPAYDDGELWCVTWGRFGNLHELGLASNELPATVVASAYRCWGERFPARLRGDFGLLLWDRKRHQAMLLRDQLGGASLFLCERGSTLFFSAEIPTMLALLPQRPPPDDSFLAHWLSLSDTRGTTPYAGIAPLRPGHVMLLKDGRWRARPYWQLSYSSPAEITLEAASRQVDRVLSQAVTRIAGRSTGVLISGGLDSSAVAALTAPGARGYAATFPNLSSVDETSWVEVLANGLGLRGRRMAFEGGSMLRAAIDCVSGWEVPLRPQNLGYFAPIVRSAADDGVEVILDGEGGDLLFGPVRELMADRIRSGSLRAAVELARRLPGAGRHPPRRRVAELVLGHGLLAALPPGWQHRLARPAYPAWLSQRASRIVTQRAVELHWAHGAGPRWWLHRVGALHDAIEAISVRDWVRRRAALAGLSAGSPFFDVDVIELIMRLPPGLAYDPGLDRPLLRQAMIGRLPEAIRLRAGKAYFNALMVDRLTGPDRPTLVRLLSGPETEIGPWVKRGMMRREILEVPPGDHVGGPAAWATLAWRLVTAECWLRQQADPSFATLELERSGLVPPSFRRLPLASV